MSTYQIDTAHSAAQFKVRHMMIANVKGEFDKVTGTVNFDPANPAASTVEASIDASTISGKIAKDVFERMWATGEEALAIVEREGLLQLSDDTALAAIVADVVARSPEQAASYRGGKAAALGWFVGQVMRQTGGRANPHRVNALLRRALGEAEAPAGR